MRRVGALPVLTLGLALLCESTAAAKPGFGVFATINGKKFRAPSTGKPDDRCVSGNYVASGGIVFGALECRGRGHRKRSRRNPKVLAFACGVVNPPDQPPPTPPFEAPCFAAGYTEVRTGRLGIPVSMKEWLSSLSLQTDPDGTVVERSSVNIRIDSFDGTYVRGAFFGVFDTPQQPGTPTQAPISGEGRFSFPVREVAQ
jgi:hypothetical protein